MMRNGMMTGLRHLKGNRKIDPSPFVMKSLIALVFMFLATGVSLGQDEVFNIVADNYLAELQQTKTPVFYTACATASGKAVLIFSLNGRKSMIFDFRRGRAVNAAKVDIVNSSVILDIANTQGGVYTYTVLENYAKDLSHQPFTLALPIDVKDIFKATPSVFCTDKPPSY